MFNPLAVFATPTAEPALTSSIVTSLGRCRDPAIVARWCRAGPVLWGCCAQRRAGHGKPWWHLTINGVETMSSWYNLIQHNSIPSSIINPCLCIYPIASILRIAHSWYNRACFSMWEGYPMSHWLSTVRIGPHRKVPHQASKFPRCTKLPVHWAPLVSLWVANPVAAAQPAPRGGGHGSTSVLRAASQRC